MKVNLAEALSEEKSIWDIVYKRFECEGHTAYCCPDNPEFPQWNIVYPKKLEEEIPLSVKEQFLKFFRHNACRGHYYTEDTEASDVVSVDEFFTLASSVQGDVIDNVRTTTDLKSFSETLVSAYGFDLEYSGSFKEKMLSIAERTECVFLEVVEKGMPVGTLSAFRTRGGHWFAMNGAILKPYRRKGYMKQLIRKLRVECSQGEILFHSNEVNLRTKILPSFGCISLGVLQVIPMESA